MAYTFSKSQVSNPEELARLVDTHIARLHAANYEKGKPRPTPEHPIIEACIKRVQTPGKPDTYVPDYEIIDDPVPVKSLEEKKADLVRTILETESKVLEGIVPTRKRRLLNLKFNEASSKKVENRTGDDLAVIDEYMKLHLAFNRMHRIGAEAEAAIEDLTEATIDNYQLPTFE